MIYGQKSLMCSLERFPYKFTTEGGPPLRTTSLVATVSKVSEDAYIFFRAFEWMLLPTHMTLDNTNQYQGADWYVVRLRLDQTGLVCQT